MLCHYRLGQALRIPGGSGSQNFKTTSTWRWSHCQSYIPTAFTHQEIFLVLISCTGRADPKASVRLEGLGQRKIPLTSSGNEPVTSSLQHSASTKCSPHIPQWILWVHKSRQNLTTWVTASEKDLWSMGVEISDDIRRYKQGKVVPA
jgi:hypothetical protein